MKDALYFKKKQDNEEKQNDADFQLTSALRSIQKQSMIIFSYSFHIC